MTEDVLVRVLRIVAPVFLLVGALHVIYGVEADVMLGALVPVEALSDPTLNSQNRFYGVAFTVYGVLFMVCAGDLRKYQTVLRALVWVFFAAGLARLLSIATHGLPSSAILILLALELLLPPMLLFWLRRAMTQSGELSP